MKAPAKALARVLLGDYGLYQVWVLGPGDDVPTGACQNAGFEVREIDRRDVDAATDSSLRESAWYLGDESLGFGCFHGGELVGLSFYWHGQRYRRRRSVTIGIRDAKLVHIVTAPAMRGRRVATMLIARSAVAMRARGFRTLYARVWHSNGPSRQAFARAGWRPTGWWLEINPMRRRNPWTLYLGHRSLLRVANVR